VIVVEVKGAIAVGVNEVVEAVVAGVAGVDETVVDETVVDETVVDETVVVGVAVVVGVNAVVVVDLIPAAFSGG
jgi:hypothetical protein